MSKACIEMDKRYDLCGQTLFGPLTYDWSVEKALSVPAKEIKQKMEVI